MGRDFGVRALRVGALQEGQRAFEVALPVRHPGHAVENERVVGRQLECFFDQLTRFRQPHVAVRVGVAERVVRLRALWLQFDQLAQAGFHEFQAVKAFGQQGSLIEQFRLLGLFAEFVVQQGKCRLGLLRVSQQGRFGDRQLDAQLRVTVRRSTEFISRLVELALPGEDGGSANLRRKVVLARANLLIIGQRLVVAPAFFGHLAKVVVGRALVRDVECDQVLELRLGEHRVVFLEGKDGDREDHVRVVRIGQQQLLEQPLGFAIALLAHQGARQLQLGIARLRILLDKDLQRGDGLGRRLACQQLCFQQGADLPIRAQVECLPRFRECAVVFTSRAGSDGDSVVRFGKLLEGFAHLADQLQDGLAVRAAGKHPVECQQVPGQ